MAKNTSISLGDHFEKFIRRKVRSGRFASSSEVIREGLRLLEQKEEHLKAVREALVAGEQSGPPSPFDNEAFKTTMHRKHMKPNVSRRTNTTRKNRS